MHTSSFNLRGVAPNVMLLLKKEAERREVSVNSLILQMINQGLGITHKKEKMIFHDLDHLAGTWSEKEWKEFEKNIKSFEKIDEELWS